MAKLRWPLRLYILAVVFSAVAGLVAAAATPEPSLPNVAWLFAAMFVLAVVAQLRVVHLSSKMKLTVDDTPIFAGVLLFGPFLAMLLAGGSIIASSFVRSGRWYNRAFNASVNGLGAGLAATVFALLAGGDLSVSAHPFAVAAAAVVLYLTRATLVDVVVALQLRRDPVSAWWRIHRRDMPYAFALFVLGALAAITTAIGAWTVLLFAVPIGFVFLAMREAARIREHTRLAIYELADLVDQRDPYTHGHSQRVAVYAEQLARRLRLSTTQIDLIREAARMHDVGKISTPDHVLNKPGPLTRDELRAMHAHAEDGGKLLARLPDFWEGAALVRSHHERYDRTGYPRGLGDLEIPLEAQVIAVADAYDAMATDRPYRMALSWSEIRREFANGRGSQWRPDVVDAMAAMIEAGQLPKPEPRAIASIPRTA